MSPSVHPLRIPDADPLTLAGQLADRLAASAVERDRAGGHATAERELIRDSGLLTLSITFWMA